MMNENQVPQVRSNNIFGVLVGMLIGSLAGAITMLLLAPQSGEATRIQIRDKGIELRDRTNGMMEDAKAQMRSISNKITIGGHDKIKELKQHSQEMAVQQLERVSEAAQAGKKALQNSQGG